MVIASPVVLWAGWPFYVRGVRSVIQLSPNMWTLIGLGTSAAYLYSVVVTLAPAVFPTNFMMDGRIGVYFEAATAIISLSLLGQMLELKACSQTSTAIKSLLGLVARTARQINVDGSEEDSSGVVVLIGPFLEAFLALIVWRCLPGHWSIARLRSGVGLTFGPGYRYRRWRRC